MKSLLIVGLFFSPSYPGKSQSSDLIVVKKNNRTVKTYFPGDEIMFSTNSRYLDAYITSINNDSLFLIQYDVRQVPTNLGVYLLDTIARYRFGVNYKDIISLGKMKSKSFDWAGSGGVLLGGGTLLTLVGLGTWLFSKPNTQYYASPYLVGGAALLAGIGYLLAKGGSKQTVLGKKYSLEYIKVK
jgi:hypothetical protein